VPSGYRCGIVPASDTGAVEMALWSMLGARPVDLFAWESFSEDWVTDTVKQLKIKDARTFKAPYGRLPDLGQYNPAHDAVFVWNGTTSGVKVPNGDWIPATREGLTICDATSAAFAMDLPWDKLDVVTFSWQKVLGGEAAHGVLILSPRAVARLESYTPPWPLPKIFRMTQGKDKGGKIVEGIFEGETINTPSMVAVEDYLDALSWAERVGGLKGLIKRSNDNLHALEQWVAKTGWAGFLAQDAVIRSNTSVCIAVTDPSFTALSDDAKADAIKKMCALLEKEGVALDIAGYRAAPPGLRIWCGATVDKADIEALTPWLDWAWNQIKA
jgi:phosphoserine aminotransferase